MSVKALKLISRKKYLSVLSKIQDKFKKMKNYQEAFYRKMIVDLAGKIGIEILKNTSLGASCGTTNGIHTMRCGCGIRSKRLTDSHGRDSARSAGRSI